MYAELVVGFNSVLEVQSIRASLEYFRAKVVTYWIRRPREFINILSGKGLYNDINYVIFCFHGEEGKFVMEELSEDIYEQDDRGDTLVQQKFINMQNCIIHIL